MVDRTMLRNEKTLNAIMEIVESKDFDEVSVRSICKMTGTSSSTFYKHYDDKIDCVLKCIDLYDKDFVNDFDDIHRILCENRSLLVKMAVSKSNHRLIGYLRGMVRRSLGCTDPDRSATIVPYPQEIEIVGRIYLMLVMDFTNPPSKTNIVRTTLKTMSNADKIALNAKKKHYKVLAEVLTKALESRQYEVHFCDDRQSAMEKVLALIPAESSIAWGGSITLGQIGVIDELKKGPYTVLDTADGKTPEEREEIMRKAFSVDYYLTSFNGVAIDGTIFNVDGNGNRVAAITFGPRHVIAVVGMNKVCMTQEVALARAETLSAQINACRFGYEDTLFTDDDVTQDNLNPKSMCNFIEQMTFCRTPGRVKIILVAEDLGF
ncbi:MAG: lactate utilization protein [archaeon]|nr:lactate utilization protein [archaeon]